MTMQPVAAVGIDVPLWWIVYLRGALVGRSEPYAQNVKMLRAVPSPIAPDGTPVPRPPRFVVVAHDGGNIAGVFQNARVRLDVWSDSEKNATDLANLITALAFEAAGVNGCTRVTHVSGPLDVADPSGQPRRYSLLDTTHRTSVLTS